MGNWKVVLVHILFPWLVIVDGKTTTAHFWCDDHSTSISVCGGVGVRIGVSISKRELQTYIYTYISSIKWRKYRRGKGHNCKIVKFFEWKRFYLYICKLSRLWRLRVNIQNRLGDGKEITRVLRTALKTLRLRSWRLVRHGRASIRSVHFLIQYRYFSNPNTLNGHLGPHPFTLSHSNFSC